MLIDKKKITEEKITRERKSEREKERKREREKERKKEREKERKREKERERERKLFSTIYFFRRERGYCR